MGQRLSRAQWIDAAARALTKQGVQGVRVEALARDLGVTKGSFYWHFKDRTALLTAVLEHWQQVATLAVIDEVEATGAGPAGRLEHLFDLCTRSRADHLESQIRAWAITEAKAQEVLTVVDETRQAYVAGLLQAHGLGETEAKHRARALYLALIGEFTWVAHGGPASSRAMWSSLLKLVLGT